MRMPVIKTVTSSLPLLLAFSVLDSMAIEINTTMGRNFFIVTPLQSPRSRVGSVTFATESAIAFVYVEKPVIIDDNLYFYHNTFRIKSGSSFETELPGLPIVKHGQRGRAYSVWSTRQIWVNVFFGKPWEALCVLPAELYTKYVTVVLPLGSKDGFIHILASTEDTVVSFVQNIGRDAVRSKAQLRRGEYFFDELSSKSESFVEANKPVWVIHGTRDNLWVAAKPQWAWGKKFPLVQAVTSDHIVEIKQNQSAGDQELANKKTTLHPFTFRVWNSMSKSGSLVFGTIPNPNPLLVRFFEILPVRQYTSDIFFRVPELVVKTANVNMLLIVSGYWRSSILWNAETILVNWKVPKLNGTDSLHSKFVYRVFHISEANNYVRVRSPSVTLGCYLLINEGEALSVFSPGYKLRKSTANCRISRMVPGDNVDNDCDGRVDEEILSMCDDDQDGLFGEDLEKERTDGKWTKWQYDECNATCEQEGFIIRIRLCANPAPSNGGLYCKGMSKSIGEKCYKTGTSECRLGPQQFRSCPNTRFGPTCNGTCPNDCPRYCNSATGECAASRFSAFVYNSRFLLSFLIPGFFFVVVVGCYRYNKKMKPKKISGLEETIIRPMDRASSRVSRISNLTRDSQGVWDTDELERLDGDEVELQR